MVVGVGKTQTCGVRSVVSKNSSEVCLSQEETHGPGLGQTCSSEHKPSPNQLKPSQPNSAERRNKYLFLKTTEF